MRAEDLRLGPRQVVAGKARDLLVELGAALVVEPDRRQLLRVPLQAAAPDRQGLLKLKSAIGIAFEETGPRAEPRGLVIREVLPDRAAAKAGLKAGDIMVEFDGKPIQNLYDFTYALRAKKPSDVVAVVVRRNGHDVKVNVTLEARR